MGNERKCVACATACTVYIGEPGERAVVDEWTGWQPICEACAHALMLVVQEAVDGNMEAAEQYLQHFAAGVIARQQTPPTGQH